MQHSIQLSTENECLQFTFIGNYFCITQLESYMVMNKDDHKGWFLFLSFFEQAFKLFSFSIRNISSVLIAFLQFLVYLLHTSSIKQIYSTCSWHDFKFIPSIFFIWLTQRGVQFSCETLKFQNSFMKCGKIYSSAKNSL